MVYGAGDGREPVRGIIEFLEDMVGVGQVIIKKMVKMFKFFSIMLNIVYHFNLRKSPLPETPKKFAKSPALNAINAIKIDNLKIKYNKFLNS